MVIIAKIVQSVGDVHYFGINKYFTPTKRNRLKLLDYQCFLKTYVGLIPAIYVILQKILDFLSNDTILFYFT